MKKLLLLIIAILLIGLLVFYCMNGKADGKWLKSKEIEISSEKEVNRFPDELNAYELGSVDEEHHKYYVFVDNFNRGAYCIESKAKKFICTPMITNGNEITEETNLEDILFSFDTEKSFMAKINIYEFFFMKKLNMKISALEDKCLLKGECDYLLDVSFLNFNSEIAKDLYLPKHHKITN